MATQVSEQQARQVAEAAREQEWKLPSFGKELFLGNFRLDLIHPQPKLDAAAVEKGERFLATLRAFLTENVDPLQIERDSKIPDEAVEGLKRLGALGMKVPEQYGGLGLSQVYYNKALALAGTWHSSLATLLSAHQSIGVAEPLMLFGSDEQKQKWLPLVAKDHISAFLLTEPDVGSDPARLGSTATPTEGGYLLNGRKLWATNGAIADIVVVMAQVPKADGHRGGISAFVLDYTSDGVTVEHRNAFMGLRGIENSVTRLDDVFVPAENLIGREGQGLKIALSTLNTGRLALPAICAGNAKWATKIAREWSNERVQWGAAGRQARRGGAEGRLHRRERVRPGGDARRLLPAGRRQEVRHPHRGGDRQALRLRAGLAGARRADADPRRPRLRDRPVAQGPRREAGAGRGGAARHAHQPHLRGLDRDHAPADRPRGGRPAPPGGRRDPRGRRRPLLEGQGRPSARASSTPSGSRGWPSARA